MTLPETFTIAAPSLVGPVLFDQTWSDLCLLHWRVDPADVAGYFPRGTRPDVYDGSTYVGLVPFHMRKAGLTQGHPVPYVGDFLETNVRLYSVDDEGRHGIVFRSLEASRLFTTLCARWGYGVPYTWSHQSVGTSGDRWTWRTRRIWPDRGLRTVITVDVGSRLAQPTELDHFLTSRWGLHSSWLGRTLWTPNFHEPWPLHEARFISIKDQLVRAAGVPVRGAPDVPTRWSPGVHTVFGFPQLLS